MPKRTANNRLARLLAVIPWIVDNPGQRLDQIAARFDCDVADLLDDLSVAHLVGLPPYTPDSLIEIDIDEGGRVTITLADFFSKPLRLTAAQGFSLLAASEAVLSVPRADSNSALARALKKLESSLSIRGEDVLEVSLGEVDRNLLETLNKCVDTRSVVEISYYSYGKDTYGTRKIAPIKVFSEGGYWYIYAWCLLAEDERLFRIDRIDSLKVLDFPFPIREFKPFSAVFKSQDLDPRVTLRLAEPAAWVLETYPYDKILRYDEQGVEVVLVVAAEAWLERLLMRLGKDAEVIDSVGVDAKALALRSASKILSLYTD